MGLLNGKFFKGINKTFTKIGQLHVNAAKIGLSAAFPGAGQYMASQEANETNIELQKQANLQNQRNWELQTQYNSPVEQMKRLESAGLNPNLAYGQIAESRMASAPSMEAAHVEPASFGNNGALSTLADFQQVMNMQEMNHKIRLDNKLSAQELKYRKYENDYLKDKGMLRGDQGTLRLWQRGTDFISDRVNTFIKWMETENQRHYNEQLRRKREDK